MTSGCQTQKSDHVAITKTKNEGNPNVTLRYTIWGASLQFQKCLANWQRAEIHGGEIGFPDFGRFGAIFAFFEKNVKFVKTGAMCTHIPFPPAPRGCSLSPSWLLSLPWVPRGWAGCHCH